MSAARAWDAVTYDRVSTPQVQWADAVLQRLELAGDETVLDAGCGSGRVTELLLGHLPRGRVVAVDADREMVRAARGRLGARADVRQAELTELALDEPVDAVFSNAVLHWIDDHERLFSALHAALRPGGRLSAQCGGEGNVARFQAVADAVGAQRGLEPWPRRPWNFAAPGETEERLRAAGFRAAECWLQPWPVRPDEPRAYLETVCLGPYLERLREPDRAPFVAAVLERMGELELDYVRLNIVATR